MRGTYNTKQKSLITEFLQAHPYKSFSCDELYELLNTTSKVGKATIYRVLEGYSKDQQVFSFKSPKELIARYAYVPSAKDQTTMICDECHTVFPIACSSSKSFLNHIVKDHSFKITAPRFLMFGVCKECQEK